MEKNKSNKVIIIILVVVLICVAAFSIYIFMDSKSKDKQIENMENAISDLQSKEDEKDGQTAQNKEENNAKEENSTSIDTNKYNEDYAKRILQIYNSGDAIAIFYNIIQKDVNYQEIDSFEVVENNGVNYYITNTDYSEFKAKLNVFLTDEGIESLFDNFKYGGKQNVIEINGKVAVAEYGWSGNACDFLSQKLISNENGKYVYEVSYRSPLTMELLEYETKTMKLTGVVEDGTYKISNIEC